ncbi:hypothetical protein [Filimonas effusa]|uniref:Permease n=1 Tax=Filimonas effusa TaxID=2508721 RepID=A0A4Q1DBU3_9BACT|nr:hypothetical protein [Filimonas effusa]RXK85989.1 hypothetical protein ESB13_04040 [Filimonas effusa]
MMKKRQFSKNPLHYVYALIWLSLFVAFAVYIFSGKMFLPDENGKISLVAILVGWVAEYLTQVGTGILVVLIGLYVAFKTATEKKV